MGKNIGEDDMKKVTGGSAEPKTNETIDDVIYDPTDDIDDDIKKKIKG